MMRDNGENEKTVGKTILKDQAKSMLKGAAIAGGVALAVVGAAKVSELNDGYKKEMEAARKLLVDSTLDYNLVKSDVFPKLARWHPSEQNDITLQRKIQYEILDDTTDELRDKFKSFKGLSKQEREKYYFNFAKQMNDPTSSKITMPIKDRVKTRVSYAKRYNK